ncbi:MAG TPA: cell division protein ZapA [Chitinophagales bacterium]|nr:cell division protein ZapA [Chitinophagales bacterium]HRG26413.1 cell division protein ZapA [Chitinophagales bacterium]HRG84163.1 cell division protein ZapA [Chitinophagales bacterium]HRH54190.1 cell division protein ZapA [Chitinophagales bacterium]
MDTEESKLLNIHVTICDRPYRLKVKPEEEEIVRKAARIIAEKIKDLQMQHAGNDKQDYLAMTVLTMMVEQLGAEQKQPEPIIAETDFSAELEQLNQQISKALHP